MEKQANGQKCKMDKWTNGKIGKRANMQNGNQTNGHLDNWTSHKHNDKHRDGPTEKHKKASIQHNYNYVIIENDITIRS